MESLFVHFRRFSKTCFHNFTRRPNTTNISNFVTIFVFFDFNLRIATTILGRMDKALSTGYFIIWIKHILDICGLVATSPTLKSPNMFTQFLTSAVSALGTYDLNHLSYHLFETDQCQWM